MIKEAVEPPADCTCADIDGDGDVDLDDWRFFHELLAQACEPFDYCNGQH